MCGLQYFGKMGRIVKSHGENYKRISPRVKGKRKLYEHGNCFRVIKY